MSVYQYRYVAEGEGVRCDFCSNAFVKWEYPTEDFEMPAPRMGSVGSWMACDKCHDLIETGKWDFLAHHALSTYTKYALPVGTTPNLRQTMERELMPKFKEMFAAFRSHRKGEAKAVAIS